MLVDAGATAWVGLTVGWAGAVAVPCLAGVGSALARDWAWAWGDVCFLAAAALAWFAGVLLTLTDALPVLRWLLLLPALPVLAVLLAEAPVPLAFETPAFAAVALCARALSLPRPWLAALALLPATLLLPLTLAPLFPPAVLLLPPSLPLLPRALLLPLPALTPLPTPPLPPTPLPRPTPMLEPRPEPPAGP